MLPTQRTSGNSNTTTQTDYATTLPVKHAVQNHAPSNAATEVNPTRHPKKKEYHPSSENSTSPHHSSSLRNKQNVASTTTKINLNSTSGSNNHSSNRNKGYHSSISTPRHFILSTHIHDHPQDGDQTDEAYEYQLIKHFIRCHLKRQQARQKQQSPKRNQREHRRRSKKREEGTPQYSPATVVDDRKNHSTKASLTQAEVAQQRKIQKEKIKSLMEQQEKHRALLQKAHADNERLKSQMGALQAKHEARLAELLKQQQCGGDGIILQKKKKKKKRQKQKKKEQQQQLRRQQDDRLSTDEDEEEEEAGENDEIGIGGNLIESSIGNKEFELRRKAKEKTILLLKQEQKEYTNKAKKARESLAELERKWKREDEEQSKVWKKEDEEMMKENEHTRLRRKQGTETSAVAVADCVYPMKSSRKKRKAEELTEQKEGGFEQERNHREGDEHSIRNGNSSSLFNDSRRNSLNSTITKHNSTKSAANTSTTSVTRNNKRSGKAASDVRGEKNKIQLESERKKKDLQRKNKELDELNQTKNRMTWLLKQVILAKKKHKSQSLKSKANGVTGNGYVESKKK